MSPDMTLAFEDFPVGHFGTFGPRHVTREEIIAFASEFDPQPMHLDEAAAERSMLRGLSGSGWHLSSLMMRMLFDGFIGRTASLGSPGVDELRWMSPLRPGDDLTLQRLVVDAVLTLPESQREGLAASALPAELGSGSRPETGIVTFKMKVRNASGQTLVEATSPIIVKRRDGGTGTRSEN